MQVHLLTIVCKFGGDPAICLREEAICAKVYRQTDRQIDGRTDDGRLATALAHSWNELKMKKNSTIRHNSDDFTLNHYLQKDKRHNILTDPLRFVLLLAMVGNS